MAVSVLHKAFYFPICFLVKRHKFQLRSLKTTITRMDIWHLDNNHSTALLLWRTDKDNFRIMQSGEFKTLLNNPDYILLDNKYAEIFKKLSDQITFQKVKITGNNLDIAKDNYIELNILNSITPISVKTLDGNGLKIWKYEGQIFVSSDLKTELVKICKNDFRFTIGFSNFG